MFISLNGMELEISADIKKRGGEWIFCLHGLQSNKHLFDELLSRPFFEKYSLCAIDFVGFGDSSKSTEFSYDLRDQARVCEKVISKLNAEKVHIIGHSIGGMVGTLLLRSIPEKVSSFVNMEGNFVFEDCGASKDVVAMSLEEFCANGFTYFKNTLETSTEKNATLRRKWIEQIPGYVFYKTSVSIVELSKSGELLETFLESPCQKLYLCGDKNRKKAAVLNGKIELAQVPNAGHFMLLDNAEDSPRLIEKFLEKANKN